MGGTRCSLFSRPQGGTGRDWETVEDHSNQLSDALAWLRYSAVLSSQFPTRGGGSNYQTRGLHFKIRARSWRGSVKEQILGGGW